ncbi:hypothetical protein CDAR_532681 [Caerostris darwini]|uniref:Uncharacterized protein n=1 Tax=Caerostris darwini TaxID=1538125 RepID=A0AAV4VYW2_9ARAC|nr:hypothetical protein CDAR_532681 [Caerostris darwini]
MVFHILRKECTAIIYHSAFPPVLRGKKQKKTGISRPDYTVLESIAKSSIAAAINHISRPTISLGAGWNPSGGKGKNIDLIFYVGMFPSDSAYCKTWNGCSFVHMTRM